MVSNFGPHLASLETERVLIDPKGEVAAVGASTAFVMRSNLEDEAVSVWTRNLLVNRIGLGDIPALVISSNVLVT